jgi:uncharacterized protein
VPADVVVASEAHVREWGRLSGTTIYGALTEEGSSVAKPRRGDDLAWLAIRSDRLADNPLRYLVAMVSRNLIDQAGKTLAEVAGPDSTVILFGSHARGEASADSDVDFLVIEPVVANRLEEWERLRRALKDFPAPVDIVVVDEARAEVPGTMVHHAMRDGRVLAHA